jgi:hypothetical protein
MGFLLPFYEIELGIVMVPKNIPKRSCWYTMKAQAVYAKICLFLIRDVRFRYKIRSRGWFKQKNNESSLDSIILLSGAISNGIPLL